MMQVGFRRLLGVLMFGLLLLDAAIKAATITVEPSQTTVNTGDSFALAINASGAADLYAFQFNLQFNPTVLSASSVSEGSFLSSSGSTFFIPGGINNSTGNVLFTADTLLGNVPGVNGGGSLATINFQALSVGTSPIVLYQTIFVDSQLDSASANVANGSVSVTDASAVPEPGTGIFVGVVLVVVLIFARHRWSRTIAPVLFVVCVVASFKLPGATFAVTSTNDAVDTNPGDGQCNSDGGQCTLRAAIQETNALPGADVINVPAGLYQITLRGPNETMSAKGDLNIRDSLTIRGAGAESTTIDGGTCPDVSDDTCDSDQAASDDDRVFSIINTGTDPIVNMLDLRIQNGGGLVISGGGIYVSAGSRLQISNSVITRNRSTQFGGAITNSGGSVQVTRCELSRNSLPIHELGGQTASGGAIFGTAGAVTKIDRSTIRNNEAARGGGIRNAGGQLEITNSTISGNKATAGGGGILTFGSTSISYTTITDNEASRNVFVSGGGEPRLGGGIYNKSGVYKDSVESNVSIANSILAGNTDNRDRFENDYAPDCYSVDKYSFTSYRGNVVGIINSNCSMRDTLFGEQLFDQVGPLPCPNDPSTPCPLDARLQSLAYVGGPTPTHGLKPDSLAIDRGDGGAGVSFFGCPARDQRGYVRPVKSTGAITSGCDTGSFEFDSHTPEDVNADGTIDCADLTAIKNSIGTFKGQSNYDPSADVNNDGAVNVKDLAAVSKMLANGTSCPQ